MAGFSIWKSVYIIHHSDVQKRKVLWFYRSDQNACLAECLCFQHKLWRQRRQRGFLSLITIICGTESWRHIWPGEPERFPSTVKNKATTSSPHVLYRLRVLSWSWSCSAIMHNSPSTSSPSWCRVWAKGAQGGPKHFFVTSCEYITTFALKNCLEKIIFKMFWNGSIETWYSGTLPQAPDFPHFLPHLLDVFCLLLWIPKSENVGVPTLLMALLGGNSAVGMRHLPVSWDSVDPT